jgi:hypothetical protein
MNELKAKLSQFYGTQEYHHNGMTLLYTDGVKALIEEAQCFWLISDISIVVKMKFKGIPFQVWNITVNPSHRGMVTMREFSGAPVLYKHNYHFTDFPVGSFDLWVIDGVIILPSEY